MKDQRQRQQESTKSAFQIREEEYRAARRAGAEAVEIGRETLESATRQGEQLHHAERMADETSYDLDQAGRVLRGMTWTGWMANVFAKELKPPMPESERATALVPSSYDNAPPTCRGAAQAVQNYHANLKVLATCETTEQTETCHLICENMYGVALTQLNQLVASQRELDPEEQSFCQTLKQDLANLRSRQQIRKRAHQRQQKEAEQYQKSREALELPNGTVANHHPKDYSSKPMEALVADHPEARRMLHLQDQHLDDMAQHLDELGNLALNLGEATERQAALVEILDTKADTILGKSQMVTRRTERLIQQKAWTPAKPTFQACVSIQHVPTQKYLAVTNGTLVLRSKMDYESCYFEVWKRQGSIFGLQSRFNRKWVGQNMLGNLECRATSFGKRQEFETEKPWNETPLLCASAGWGAGSYVVVTGKEETVNIAAVGSVTSRSADLWCLKETH